jgi:predicted 2-oxoglutarate/Fe(II)-dependent dioxygenase YbiX
MKNESEIPSVISLFFNQEYRSEYAKNYESLILDIKNDNFYLNIEDYVKVYSNILSTEICNKLSALIEEYPNKIRFSDDLNNLLRSGEFADMRKNKKFDLYVRSIIDKLLKVVIKNYSQDVKSFYYSYGDSINHYHYHALKYGKNDNFKIHHDHYAETLNYSRLLTVCVYLNEDYDGGELEFPSIKKTFKFKTGDVIVFPSNWMFYHGVNPILSGNRYSLTVWAGIDINNISGKKINHEW